MKRILFFTLVLILNISLLSQNYDVRKTFWGASINDVLNSEYNQPAEITKDKIIYTDIVLENDTTATIVYNFSNGMLSEVIYSIYGPKHNPGTCTNFIPFTHKIINTMYVFGSLHEKGMRTPFGWDINPKGSNMLDERLKTGHWDMNTINVIKSEITRLNARWVQIDFSNKRTNAHINFDVNKEFVEMMTALYKCDDPYFNMYLTIRFYPIYSARDEINKNNF